MAVSEIHTPAPAGLMTEASVALQAGLLVKAGEVLLAVIKVAVAPEALMVGAWEGPTEEAKVAVTGEVEEEITGEAVEETGKLNVNKAKRRTLAVLLFCPIIT